MERMTFYIPPVFLFGNKVRHNQEENKAEYKTAAETEIKIENWNIKRIAELEEENKNLKAIIEHYKKFEEGKNKLEGMLMEEDTLQELRNLGKI